MKPLAQRITPGEIIAADNDPSFLYILNSEGFNRIRIHVRHGTTDEGDPTSKPERYANASLITEAFTVAQSTGMSPKELAERVRELEGALELIIDKPSGPIATNIALNALKLLTKTPQG